MRGCCCCWGCDGWTWELVVLEFAVVVVVAVSYTHLDVYKRQVMCYVCVIIICKYNL